MLKLALLPPGWEINTDTINAQLLHFLLYGISPFLSSCLLGVLILSR